MSQITTKIHKDRHTDYFNGGSFGSGFAGGALGNMAGEASKGMGLLEQAGIAGLAGGTTSWATGGDFATGFQSGANNMLYNKGADQVLGFAKKLVSISDNFLDSKGVSFGGTLDWCGVNISIGIGQGPWLQKAIQTPNLGVGIYGSWNPTRSKNLVVAGLGKSAGLGGYFNKFKPAKGVYGAIGVALPIPITAYRSF